MHEPHAHDHDHRIGSSIGPS